MEGKGPRGLRYILGKQLASSRDGKKRPDVVTELGGEGVDMIPRIRRWGNGSGEEKLERKKSGNARSRP